MRYAFILALLATPALSAEPTACLTQSELQIKLDAAVQTGMAQYMAREAQTKSQAVDEKLKAAFAPTTKPPSKSTESPEAHP